MSNEWFLLDMLDDDDCQAAKSKLAHAQKYGLDKYVWDIYNGSGHSFPIEQKNIFESLFGLKKEFMKPNENEARYLKCFFNKGTSYYSSKHLHSIYKSIILNFDVVSKDIVKNKEKISFYNVDNDSLLGGIVFDLEDVEGIVEVRTHNLKLNYISWGKSKHISKMNGSLIEKPDLVNYYW